MKIAISAPGAKREIEGSFALCATRADFKHVVEQLQARLADETWSYGWISIPEPGHRALADTPASPWSAS